MNRSIRLSDIGDIRPIGRANTISKQLQDLAAYSALCLGRISRNQSEEATPTVPSSPTGGAPVPCGPANFQDVDATADFYTPGISRSAI